MSWYVLYMWLGSGTRWSFRFMSFTFAQKTRKASISALVQNVKNPKSVKIDLQRCEDSDSFVWHNGRICVPVRNKDTQNIMLPTMKQWSPKNIKKHIFPIGDRWLLLVMILILIIKRNFGTWLPTILRVAAEDLSTKRCDRADVMQLRCVRCGGFGG